MQISNPDADTLCNELDLIGKHLPLDNAIVLELGCGTARMTRLIAERFPVKRINAHVQADGACFANPVRIDLLRKPA